MIAQPSPHHMSSQELFLSHKRIIDLFKVPAPPLAFGPAALWLFDRPLVSGRPLRVGNQEIGWYRLEENRASFLPTSWRDELQRFDTNWRGCEKWWAGTPLVVWVNFQLSGDTSGGSLALRAEVGPLANHAIRTSMIVRIAGMAAEQGLRNIKFPADALSRNSQYSQFLTNSVRPVNDVHDRNELASRIAALVADFKSEFDLVADALSSLRHQGG